MSNAEHIVASFLARQEAVRRMQEGFVSRGELAALLGCGDRKARQFVQGLRQEYPVISSSRHKGYKIATSESDAPLVQKAISDNRAKALSILSGMKKLRSFAKEHGDLAQFTIKFE